MIRSREATPSITVLIGRSRACLRPFSKSKSTAAGYTATGQQLGHRGSHTIDVGIKSEIYRNNQHEMLVSAGVLWGIGHSGAQAVGADEPNQFSARGVFRQRVWRFT